MTIALAFDCSGGRLDVAIVEDRPGASTSILAHLSETLERGHAARLLPSVKQTLAAARLGLKDIDLLAVTVGPGSFTGVRIGLAAARGLALATGKPLAGYASLAVLLAAAQRTAKGETVAVAATDTKRGDLYLALSSAPREAFLGDARTLHAMLPRAGVRIVGDAAATLQTALAALGVTATADLQLSSPDAAVLAALALEDGVAYWRTRNSGEGLPRPLYLRDAAVTLADGTRTTAASPA